METKTEDTEKEIAHVIDQFEVRQVFVAGFGKGTVVPHETD